MVKIHYAERATTNEVASLIDYINKKLRQSGKKQRFEYEASSKKGKPMKWTINEIKSGHKQMLLSNATNKEVYLYFLGMNFVL